MAKTKTARGMAAAPMETKYVPTEDRKNGPFDDYEVRSALETLTRADKIKRNKALMRAVRTMARQQLATLQKTTESL